MFNRVPDPVVFAACYVLVCGIPAAVVGVILYVLGIR